MATPGSSPHQVRGVLEDHVRRGPVRRRGDRGGGRAAQGLGPLEVIRHLPDEAGEALGSGWPWFVGAASALLLPAVGCPWEDAPAAEHRPLLGPQMGVVNGAVRLHLPDLALTITTSLGGGLPVAFRVAGRRQSKPYTPWAEWPVQRTLTASR